jgi:hypothetical protein
MPKVRPNAAERWARRAAGATQDYVAGVQSPRTSWAQATTAAAQSYQQGVQQALSEGRWQRGVAAAGDAKWQGKTVAKGQSRYGEGVSQGAPDYQQAVAPYLQVIESTNLPPRGPKGDPRNIERVRVIAQALRARKLQAAGRAALAFFLASAITWATAGCTASWAVKESQGQIKIDNPNHR